MSDIMKITWHGHSAFEIEGKYRTLVDPFFTGNRMARVGWQEMKPDVIAVTHGHSDHLGDTINIARSTGCTIVAISELADYLGRLALRTVDLNFGGTVDLGARYSLVPAVHSSGVEEGGLGIDAGSPAGFIIEDGKTVYHAGDTALFSDMVIIKELYKPEIAMLPIGGRFTMDIKAASIAAALIRPEIIIPMHYNTFEYNKADVVAFKLSVESSTDTEVIIPVPGEPIDL